MRRYQPIFMLLLTLAVGAMFLIRVPQGQDAELRAKDRQIANLQATIAFYQSQPTPLPTATPSPTPDPLLLTPTPPPISIPTPIQNAPLTAAPSSGSRAVRVDASLSVDAAGCAISPSSSFSPTDTIYGVATLADMQSGDELVVRFTYDTTNQVIYEETFTIRQAGSYCRWYVVEPDALGWGAGSYTVSYQVNDSPPVTITYTVQDGGSIPALDPAATEEAMMEDGS